MRLFPRGLAAALLLLTLLSAQEAHAGRRPFIWTYDTEVVPERGVELEQWVWEREPQQADQKSASIWWAPVIGVTDNVELAFPIEWFWWEAGDATQLETWGGDLRIRLASPDPAQAGPVVPLLRLGVKRLVRGYTTQVEGNAVASSDLGDLHAALDVGMIAWTDGSLVAPTLGAGLSYGLPANLRLGGELFGQYQLEGPKASTGWVMVGPNVAWTHGRVWLTAGVLVGVSRFAPELMPRLLWAVAF